MSTVPSSPSCSPGRSLRGGRFRRRRVPTSSVNGATIVGLDRAANAIERALEAQRAIEAALILEAMRHVPRGSICGGRVTP
jgi:hypothetical protein